MNKVLKLIKIILPAFFLCSCATGKTSDVKVTSFSFNINNPYLEIYDHTEISEITVLPSNSTNKEIVFTVENEEIASIYKTTITGLKAGSTKIIGKTTDGSNLTVTRDLIVYDNFVGVNAFIFDLKETAILAGKTTTICDELVLPENATNKEIEYSSENPLVASIENKVITGLSAGQTKIIGRTKDGSNIVFERQLNVYTDYVTGFTTNIESTMKVGDVQSFKVTALPSDAGNKEYTCYISSGDSITLSGQTITAVKEGTSVITIEAKDNGHYKKNIGIEVYSKDGPEITFDTKGKQPVLYIGDSMNISASAKDKQDNPVSVTVSVSPTSTSIISLNGTTVTGLAKGIGTLVAKTNTTPSYSKNLNILVDDDWTLKIVQLDSCMQMSKLCLNDVPGEFGNRESIIKLVASSATSTMLKLPEPVSIEEMALNFDILIKSSNSNFKMKLYDSSEYFVSEINKNVLPNYWNSYSINGSGKNILYVEIYIESSAEIYLDLIGKSLQENPYVIDPYEEGI